MDSIISAKSDLCWKSSSTTRICADIFLSPQRYCKALYVLCKGQTAGTVLAPERLLPGGDFREVRLADLSMDWHKDCGRPHRRVVERGAPAIAQKSRSEADLRIVKHRAPNQRSYVAVRVKKGPPDSNTRRTRRRSSAA